MTLESRAKPMHIVGIDLGTTNSLVALWAEDGPRLIPNVLGEVLTPSAVGLDESGAVLVGRAAAERLVTHPGLTVASFKRWMGTARETVLGRRKFRPEELSALVLRQLKADAEAHLGGAIREAVISVPAYFSDPQRKATLAAASLAGLKVERLVNEPTAAALAYGLQQSAEGQFLVFDLGGGTFDVSILDKYEGVFEVRATAGDNFLGGGDFSEAVASLVLARHRLTRDHLTAVEQGRLARGAEGVKLELSRRPAVDYRLRLGAGEIDGTVSRDEFEAAAAPLLRRLRAPLERAIRDAQIAPEEIDGVVMVGGATRMPMVRSLVARLFGRLPLVHIDPDQTVALGAAVQAGLKARHAALDDVVMTDVCPYTLGTSAIRDQDTRSEADLVMVSIIERNAIVPVSRSRRFYTVHDRQRAIQVDIYQGESIRPENNLKLGEVVVPVPVARAGEESIDIRFTYDVNGALEVEVTVLSTGRVERRIFAGTTGLDERELSRRFAAMAELKTPPREQAANRALLARAERLYEEVLGAERDAIRRLLDQFEVAIADSKRRDLDAVRRELAEALDRFERFSFDYD